MAVVAINGASGDVTNDSWWTGNNNNCNGTGSGGGGESGIINPLDEVDWSNPGLIISLVILGAVNVLVLLGNCLVVLAVFLDTKLRTVTNLFIVSLAMADLSVGLAVLPFSASLEVLNLWVFGDVWCSIWLAVDVWMCTASILNLCAISLDRYLAVTRPVSYPSIMTPFRAKILLAVVWLLSFLICFPPLVGWNDRSNKVSRTTSAAAATSATAGQQPTPLCPDQQQQYLQQHWTCELTNDPGYVVYSALGSFFIPMFVMLFFYWRIYRAAIETTKAINQGFRTTKEAGAAAAAEAGAGRHCGVETKERLTLRIHRGRSVHSHSHQRVSNSSSNSSGGGAVGGGGGISKMPKGSAAAAAATAITSVLLAKRSSAPGIGPALAINGLPIPKSPPSSSVTMSNETMQATAVERKDCDLCSRDVHLQPLPQQNASSDDDDQQQQQQNKQPLQQQTSSGDDSSTGLRENVSNASQAYKVLYMETPLCGCGSGSRSGSVARNGRKKKRNPLEFFQMTSGSNGNATGQTMAGRPSSSSSSSGASSVRSKCSTRKSRYLSGTLPAATSAVPLAGGVGVTAVCDQSTDAASIATAQQQPPAPPSSSSSSTMVGTNNKPVVKLNRRNIKAQVKRFRMETKAAKTLGIIVGGFIVCWMPFFTMYVVRAFCPQCIPSTLFSVLFWLGYCNSAINPCIYAMFSRDFRYAFQKIVCQCLCTRRSHLQHLSCIKMMIPQGMIGGIVGVGPVAINGDDEEYNANDQSESN